MCNFFSAIVIRGGDVLFTEEDSHETVIARSGLEDNLEHFVRVEYNREEGYRIDEESIPEWYERIAAKVEANAKATFAQVEPFHIEYEKITCPAWGDYKKIRQSMRTDYEEEQMKRLIYETKEQFARKTYSMQLKKIGGYTKKYLRNKKRKLCVI